MFGGVNGAIVEWVMNVAHIGRKNRSKCFGEVTNIERAVEVDSNGNKKVEVKL